MTQSWIIGGRSDCDLVIDQPTVSGRHCRLSRVDGGFLLEDLGSTNGTFVNGVKLTGAVRVTRADTITLGPSVPMPWPPGEPASNLRTFRIGREADNDLVVDLPVVSGHHAQILWDPKTREVFIEDLHSSNGTALGAPDRRITRAPLSEADTVYLGNHPVAATFILARIDPLFIPVLTFRGTPTVLGRDPASDVVIDRYGVSSRHARLTAKDGQTWIEDLGSSNGTFVNDQRIDRATPLRLGDLVSLGSYTLLFKEAPSPAPVLKPLDPVPAAPSPAIVAPVPSPYLATVAVPSLTPAQAEDNFTRQCLGLLTPPWRLLALLAQAPWIGLIIGIFLRSRSGSGINAGVLSWLGFGAVWFGLSNAILSSSGKTSGARTPTGVLARFLVLSVLGILQCILAWAIAANLAGLKGPGVPMLALLIMAAEVGLACGLAVVLLVPQPRLAWAFLPVAFIALWLFGGEQWPMPRMASWAKAVAGVVPSRWTFEGLLLLEAENLPARGAEDAPAVEDPVEPYFPADSDRMGVRADTMALVAMLVGLAGSAAFLAMGGNRVQRAE